MYAEFQGVLPTNSGQMTNCFGFDVAKALTLYSGLLNAAGADFGMFAAPKTAQRLPHEQQTPFTRGALRPGNRF